MPTWCFPPGPWRLRSIACAPRDTPLTYARTRGWITTYRTLKQPTSALPSKRSSADRPLPTAPYRSFTSVPPPNPRERGSPSRPYEKVHHQHLHRLAVLVDGRAAAFDES